MAPNHFILSYYLPKQGHAVLSLATDIHLPGSTRNPMAIAPDFVREALSSQLPAGSELPSTYTLEFPVLPAHLAQLASWLLPRLSPERGDELALHIAETGNNAASRAGNPYEDDGWFLAGGDRLLAWMLGQPTGLLFSPNPLASEIATMLLEFLNSPDHRGRLINRAAAFGTFTEMATPDLVGKYQEVRHALRAGMAMVSEYQGWEQINPKQPTPEALVANRGRGILRALAERSLKLLGISQGPHPAQQAYLNELADQLTLAIASPEPLPYAYPASRSRVPLTQAQLNKALAL